MAKKGMNALSILGVIALIAVIIGGVMYIGGDQQLAIPGVDSGDSAVTCETNPAYSYQAVDKYSTSTITGTDQIKLDGQRPKTSLASPTVGEDLTFWVNNATSFCTPAETVTACGTQSMEAECIMNASTLTVKVKDLENDVFLTDSSAGATNVTMGATTVADLEMTYKTTSKKANMPLGGCIVVEVPNTITAVSIAGEGVTEGCPYEVTHANVGSSTVLKKFTVPAGFDDARTAMTKSMDVQLESGSSDPSGVGYVNFYPANYYVTDMGDIAFGIEKEANQDTTKTFGLTKTFTFGIE